MVAEGDGTAPSRSAGGRGEAGPADAVSEEEDDGATTLSAGLSLSFRGRIWTGSKRSQRPSAQGEGGEEEADAGSAVEVDRAEREEEDRDRDALALFVSFIAVDELVPFPPERKGAGCSTLVS